MALLAAASALQSQQPAKEYIRVGGRVIAIENSTSAAGVTLTPERYSDNTTASDTGNRSIVVASSSQTFAWKAVISGSAEVSLSGAGAFIGSQPVVYRWTANTGAARSATLTLSSNESGSPPALATITLTQSAGSSAGPPLTLDPAALNFDSCGGPGAFHVSTTPGATVVASTTSNWLGTPVVIEASPRRVEYAVAANTTAATRSGTIQVVATLGSNSTTQSFSIQQTGAGVITVPSVEQSIGAAGGALNVDVSATAGISYTAGLSLVDFAHWQGGSGPFTAATTTLHLTFDPNLTTNDRLAVVTVQSSACGVASKSFTIRQASSVLPPRSISLSPTTGPTLSSYAQSATVTPTVLVNGSVSSPAQYWIVSKIDSENFVSFTSGTAIPNTNARCGTGALTYSLTQNTDATVNARVATFTFFPLSLSTPNCGTAGNTGDTRLGPFNFTVTQAGPGTLPAQLSVNPSSHENIDHLGGGPVLQTNVSSNLAWSYDLTNPEQSMFPFTDAYLGFSPSFSGYVRNNKSRNYDTEPRSARLFITTSGTPDNYAQKIVYIQQNGAPPTYRIPTPTRFVISDSTNSNGVRGIFTVRATDTDTADDISRESLRFAADSTTNTACEVYSQRVSGSSFQFYLRSDSGTALGPLTTTLQNSQCTLRATGFPIFFAGNILDSSFDLQFKPGFAGTRNVYARAVDAANNDSQWVLLGSHAIAGAPPQFLSVTPNQGGPSSRQAFEFEISEPFGETNIQTVDVAVLPTNPNLAGCNLQYQQGGTNIMLYNSSTQTWPAATMSATGMSLGNGLCIVRGATWTTTTLGARLTVDLEFASTFGGAKVVRGQVNNDQGFATAWTTLGTWQVPDTSGFNFTGPTGTVSSTIGNETGLNFQVSSFGGFSAPVSLSVAGLPAFTTQSLSPGSITGSGFTQLRFTPPGGSSGSYPVTMRATSGSIEKTVQFTLSVGGAAALPRSLRLTGAATANTEELSGLTRLASLGNWRVDTRIHDYSGTTTRTTLFALWGSVSVYVDMDPSTNLLRLISNSEGITESSNCSVSYAGRSQLLVRLQRSSTGQYDLQLWNANGAGFATSTAANCMGTSGTQNLNYRLAIGGDLYAQPGRASGYAYWRLLSGLGSGAADPPATSVASALLAYEFDNLTLVESGSQSPTGPTLKQSAGFGTAEFTVGYVPTPNATGGPVWGLSGAFDGTRSLILDGFGGKSFLNNLSQWRAEVRIHGFMENSGYSTILSVGSYVLKYTGSSTRTIYFFDNNGEGRIPGTFFCSTNVNGKPDDLTIRIERRSSGVRAIQFWDQQGVYFGPDVCYDMGSPTGAQIPRSTNDNLGPYLGVDSRIGAVVDGDGRVSEKLKGKLAWMRFFNVAALNPNTAPQETLNSTDLATRIYGLEFDGNLNNHVPNGQASLPPTIGGSEPTYESTPGSTGGVQSASFSSGRSLTLASFDAKSYLNNMSQWRIETRLHDIAPGTVFNLGSYQVFIDNSPWRTMYISDSTVGQGYSCYIDLLGKPNDLTLRIERQSNGTRVFQLWDQLQQYYVPNACWDTPSNSPNQTARTTTDKFWPASASTPGRLGADVNNTEPFTGKLAWFRIYSTAAASDTPPSNSLSTTNLLFAAEFEGNLSDSGPNSLTIVSTVSPFTFYSGTP